MARSWPKQRNGTGVSHGSARGLHMPTHLVVAAGQISLRWRGCGNVWRTKWQLPGFRLHLRQSSQGGLQCSSSNKISPSENPSTPKWAISSSNVLPRVAYPASGRMMTMMCCRRAPSSAYPEGLCGADRKPLDVEPCFRPPRGLHADTRLCGESGGCDGGIRQELAAGVTTLCPSATSKPV